MREENTLLIRNLRGNWSARFLHEYVFRHKEGANLYFLNLIKFEVFPPHKSAPTLFNANFRESVSSTIWFKNPFPRAIKASLKANAVSFSSIPIGLDINAIKLILTLFKVKNSNELDDFLYKGVPYGKFLHTTLIAKYGVKHFNLKIHDHLGNLRTYWRYFICFKIIRKKIIDLSITKIVLINGRDIAGVAAQLCAYLHAVSVVTLEAGFGDSPFPLYGEWNGNMHHWKVRQNELSSTLEKYPDFNGANEFILKKYGTGSRWWKIGNSISNVSVTLPDDFVCFFTTSERESTCCPTGDPLNNLFDEYDQVEQLEKVRKFAKSKGLSLVVRVHPNFSNSVSANNELKFFTELTSSWENTTIIANNSNLNSYKLAEMASYIFTFRSSLSAEFSRLGVRCLQTAPTAWSHFSESFVKITEEEIMLVTSESENKNSRSTPDWVAFATYNSLHGKEFESLCFKAVAPHGKQEMGIVLDVLNGTELDIPRFKKVISRN
jgi:hypothetical protein